MLPTPLPARAATSHTHPCRLPDAMPLKYAPILQPYAIRAPYPSSRPPMMAADSEAPRQSSRGESAEDDAEVHDRGHVVHDAAAECGARRRGCPVRPRRNIHAGGVQYFRSPQSEGCRNTPGPTRDDQRGDIDRREARGTRDKRPWTTQHGMTARRRADQARNMSVTAPLHGTGERRQCRQDRQGDQQAANGPEQRHERRRLEGWCGRPPRGMHRADHRTSHERSQRDQHPGTAASRGIERARSTRSAKLHPHAEEKGASHHRHPDRRNGATHRLPERVTDRQYRKEHDARESQHGQLCAEARPPPVHEERTPGRGEAERGMVEHDAGTRTNEQQHRLAPRDECQEVDSGSADGERSASQGSRARRRPVWHRGHPRRARREFHCRGSHHIDPLFIPTPIITPVPRAVTCYGPAHARHTPTRIAPPCHTASLSNGAPSD
jgi:hypothetical protein